MEHPFFEVDVFSTGPFTGNPLAVTASAETLSDEQMRAIASWTNFSESTFLLPPTTPDADYRVRILTPTTEFPFAGHPTLGSARAWLELGNTPHTPGKVVQECAAGLVEVRVNGDELAFATPPCTRTGPLSDDELAEAIRVLDIDPSQVVDHTWADNGPGWQVVQLNDADTVRAVRPVNDRPGTHLGIVGLETGDTPNATELRAFTADFEDPVTGSLNGGVAQWLRSRGLVDPDHVAHQGSQVGRAGRVTLHDDGTNLWVGGKATIRVRGTINAT